MAAPGIGRFHSMGRNSVYMLDSFPVALGISTILGFLAGLGVGGGSLLMLWLTLMLDIPYDQAKFINLLFFLPAANISSIFRKTQGKLPLHKLWPGILTGCAAALGCCILSEYLDVTLLKKLFGGLLIFTGLREIFYRRRKAR